MEPMLLEDRLSHFVFWLAEHDVHLIDASARNASGLDYDQIESLISKYVNT